MSDELPEGWAAVALGELVRPSKNKAEPGTANGRPYIGMEHVEGETGRVLGHANAKDVRSTTVAYRAGDVLYGKLRPYLNKVTVAPFDGVGSTEFIVFPQQANLDSRYLRWLLARREFVEIANERSAGVQLPRVTFDKLADLKQPVAPLAEQRRIVAKVEALLEQVRRANDRLDRVPLILKRFRQAVLAAACSGRLTEQWRGRNGSGGVHAMLKDVAARRAKFQRGKPAEPAAEFDLDVPETWGLVSMDQLTVRITSGSRDWKKHYVDDGPGTFVMAQNVRPMVFDRSSRQAVNPPADDRDCERSSVARGDILVTIVGANTGDVCRVREDVDQHYVCQSVALMRPVLTEFAPFLEMWLNSASHGQGQYKEWIYGEGRPHLSFDHLKATAVAVPPLEEQAEIVRRVEALFAYATAIEQRVERAAARAGKLTQAIQSKAFAGELVPTEGELARAEGRDYETAEQLLERMRVQSAEPASTSKRTRSASRRVGSRSKSKA